MRTRRAGWGGRTRTSIAGSKGRCLTSLATPQRSLDCSGGGFSPDFLALARGFLRRKLLLHLFGRLLDGPRERFVADPLVLRQNPPLHSLAGVAIQRVGDVLELTVLLALRRHGNEYAVGALDHLEVRNEKAIVEDDGYVGLESLFFHRENFYLRDLH